MKISIAMATYNGEEFILEQLESFSSQIKIPDELVITDDCSTDNTLAIIEKYKKTAPFEIRVYLNEEKLEYTQNFNKAMQLCTHELIFLSDQDDVWFPTKIEYMFNLTLKYPDKALFMNDAELTDVNLKQSGLTKQGQIRGLGLDARGFVMGCCIAVRKSYLDLILAVPKGFSGHDNWIVNIADRLNLKYIDPSIQQFYRIHGNNTSIFVANRLEKTKKRRIQNLSQKIINCLKTSNFSRNSKLLSHIYEKRCLLVKIEDILQQQQYVVLAENEIISLKRELSWYEKRKKIISSNNIFIRLMDALKLYFNHQYKDFNNFESFIADIFCH